MKRKVLEKNLKEQGVRLLSHSGSHDRWVSKTGKFLWIPRHSEINEFTAKAIIKQASE